MNALELAIQGRLDDLKQRLSSFPGELNMSDSVRYKIMHWSLPSVH